MCELQPPKKNRYGLRSLNLAGLSNQIEQGAHSERLDSNLSNVFSAMPRILTSQTPRLNFEQQSCFHKQQPMQFTQYHEKEALPWLRNPLLTSQKRLKFAVEADYDTDDEAVAK